MGMIKLPMSSLNYFDKHYKEIFSTGNLAEGNWIKEIAKFTCNYTNSPFSLATNSNGSGILALLTIYKKFKNKKKIFLQSNTMYGVKTIASTSGLDICGYVDCDLNYLMPNYNQVYDFVKSISKPEECVFLLTHIGGWVNPDIEQIALLCQNKGIALIEDCAHSLGSLLNGCHTGLFGDAGVYSLYATKAIPAGEGGIVVTKHEDIYDMVQKFSIYDRFDQKLNLGVNIRMSELNALLSYSVLMETESIIQNKYRIAEKYIAACKEYDWEYIDPKINGQRANLYKFILISRSDDPEIVFQKIKSRTSPVYDYALGNDKFEIVKRHVCLPIWYKLEENLVKEVIRELST